MEDLSETNLYIDYYKEENRYEYFYDTIQNVMVLKDVENRLYDYERRLHIEDVMDIFKNLMKENKDIFTNKYYKFLDINAGTGLFTMLLYYYLYDGLRDVIKDGNERNKHIIENMIYIQEDRLDNHDYIKNVWFKNYKCNLCKDLSDFKDIDINIIFEL
jgi:hypothetical protein